MPRLKFKSKDGKWYRVPTFLDLDKKQDKLISGENIKTLNNESMLGEGNIAIPTKTSDLANDSQFVNLAMLNEALSNKENKSEGKGLSSNDFTNEYKDKLAGIEDNAQQNVIERININGTQADVFEKGVNITVPSKTSDLQNDSGYTKALHFTDVTVSASSFVDDTTLEDYPLKADIPLENVSENDYANVVFSISDVQLMNFATVCTTSDGIVTIYAKESPQENVMIPLVEVVKI